MFSNAIVNVIILSYVIFSRFPAPKFPPTNNMFEYLGPAFSIAIVAFAISISMSKLFAKKHGYEIDSNQVKKKWEMFQYKDCLSRYGDLPYKDKTVMRSSYFYVRILKY